MKASDKFFGDTYDLVDVIKDTEKSFVALVYDKHAKRLCTMKQCNPRSLPIYQTLKNLNNPHVPQIYRLFERDGKLIIIEEHIDGQTLAELLTYQMPNFNEKFVLNILLQLCDCLVPLHQANIIHRDIKPSNIMLTKDNTVKLIDFGIARIFKPDSLADTEFLGTRGYAAPEQFGLFDFRQTDARSDIYSLGITMKQLLGDDYSGWLLKILNRCTFLDPNQRFQSVTDLTTAINRNKKLWIFKRFIVVGIAIFIFFTLPQLINLNFFEESSHIEKSNDNETISTNQNIENKPNVSRPKTENLTSRSTLKQDVTQQLIDFTNSNIPNEIINLPPSPIPNIPDEKNTKPNIESADEVECLFFLNGNLTTAHYVFISDKDGYKNWKQNQYGDFLFPSDWTATLKIVNHTANDLINPHITVEFGYDGFSVDKPTIKAGQSIEMDIPLTNQLASPAEGNGTISITIESQNHEPIYLDRNFFIQ